jgi:hypothetical protein
MIQFISQHLDYEVYLSGRGVAFLLPGGQGLKPTSVTMEIGSKHASARLVGEDEVPGKTNYLFGTDSRRWLAGIPTYSKVRWSGVFPGVDVLFYGVGRQLEYDFVVHPGSSPKSISLRLNGAFPVAVGDGDLALPGEPRLVMRKPTAFQVSNGHRRIIPCEYELHSDGRIGIRLGQISSGINIT